MNTIDVNLKIIYMKTPVILGFYTFGLDTAQS